MRGVFLSFGRLSLVLAVLATGCGDDFVLFDGGPDDVGDDAPDAGQDAGPICTEDSECDDGVTCTRDVCEGGFCRNRDDSAMCDDGVFCNGLERCDRELGRCAPGEFQSCNDEDVCTIDRCDEEAKVCRYAPRDFDEDGEADWNCEGGTDCDDRDPTRSTSVNEICSDGIDNDCDEVIDEDECGRPPHDACDDPLDVSAGGFFEIATEGARPDHDLACGPDGRPDIVLSFELTEAKDVTVRAEGRGLTYVALRTVCESRSDEFECAGGFPGQVRSRALEPGTYFILVADSSGEVAVEVIFGDPTPAPSNESCASPLDISEGGSFAGTLVDVMDDLMVSCGSSGTPDVVYTFTLEEERDVIYSASSPSGDLLAAAIQSTCGGADLRCTRGSTAGGRMFRAAPGTYFLVVEGSSSRESDFQVDLSFEDPSDPPQGDVCDDPLMLFPGVRTEGTLRDKQDDHSTSCGFYYRESVHRFELTERSDVSLEVDGGGSFLYASLRSDCADQGSELRCRSGAPSRMVLRDVLPGTYFVLVEASNPLSYEMLLTVNPPTATVDVSGNDDCDSAYVVPETGGFFRGSTVTLLPDYETSICGAAATSKDAVFRLDLTRRANVIASTDGSSFDTVLHQHSGECRSGAELACDDDGGEGSASRLERTLDVGRHFFIVDGWGGGSAGEYYLELQVSEP